VASDGPAAWVWKATKVVRSESDMDLLRLGRESHMDLSRPGILSLPNGRWVGLV